MDLSHERLQLVPTTGIAEAGIPFSGPLTIKFISVRPTSSSVNVKCLIGYSRKAVTNAGGKAEALFLKQGWINGENADLPTCLLWDGEIKLEEKESCIIFCWIASRAVAGTHQADVVAGYEHE